MKIFMQVPFFFLIVSSFLFFVSCKKDNDSGTGSIQFKMTNPASTKVKSVLQQNAYSNPPLTGDVTETTMISLRFCVGDVWVSQGEVIVGGTDNLKWIKLTDATNLEQKLFEDYTFTPKELPAGTYKSIKMTFKNYFYRILLLKSNPTVKYEISESMINNSSPCDVSDSSPSLTNYFSSGGNHVIKNGVFTMANQNEKVGGFTIIAGKTVTLNWRLGAGVNAVCTNYLNDNNKNRVWDCAIDNVTISCPPQVTLMWDFVVE